MKTLHFLLASMALGIIFSYTGCATDSKNNKVLAPVAFDKYLTEKCRQCERDPFLFGFQSADFCVIGRNQTITTTKISDVEVQTEGVIKVHTWIIGDSDIKEIPYTTLRVKPTVFHTDRGDIEFNSYYDAFVDIDVTKTNNVIVWGSKQNKDLGINITVEINDTSDDATQIMFEILKSVYKFHKTGVTKDDLQKARQFLMTKATGIATNPGVWIFSDYRDELFQLTLDNEGIESAIAFLEDISGKDSTINPYKWASHLLEGYYQSEHFNSDQKELLKKVSPNHAKLVNLASSMTKSQRQRLQNIIEKNQ